MNRELTVMESYEAKDYVNFLNARYQRALRKSGKGWAAKSLGPTTAIAVCIAALVACPLFIYSIVKKCYYPDDKEKEAQDEQPGYSYDESETTTSVDEAAQSPCSAGYGAGMIVLVLTIGAVSCGLFIFCYGICKRYVAEENLVHAGAAKIRVDGRDNPGQYKSLVVEIGDSYHLYFLQEDPMVRRLDEHQIECPANIISNCWFETDVNDDTVAEINDVQLSDYIYSLQNPLLWQKYQSFCNTISTSSMNDQGGYINLECYGSDFDLKSLLTFKYIRDVETAFRSTWSPGVPRFTGQDGLFFVVVDVKEIIPILNKGLPLKKGPLGKAVYMYENIKTAVEKPVHQLFCEPKVLLVVRALVRNVCTLSEGVRLRPRDLKKYSVAVVESQRADVIGREFAFFNASMCVPLYVAVYRRKFRKEATRMREAVLQIMNEDHGSSI